MLNYGHHLNKFGSFQSPHNTCQFHGNQPSSPEEKDLDLFRLVNIIYRHGRHLGHVTWTIQIKSPPSPPPNPLGAAHEI